MRLLLQIFMLSFFPLFSDAQQNPFLEVWTRKQGDSLLQEWLHNPNDTIRMKVARSLGWFYQERHYDSSLYFNEHQLALANRFNLKLWKGDALDQKGWVLSQMKNYSGSLRCFLEGLKILEDEATEKNIWSISTFSKLNDPKNARLIALSTIHNDLSRLYSALDNNEKEIINLFLAIKRLEERSGNDYSTLCFPYMNLGEVYLKMNKLDSALTYVNLALSDMNKTNYKFYEGWAMTTLGKIYLANGNYALAKHNFIKGMFSSLEQNNKTSLPYTYISLADLFRSSGEIDSAIIYSVKALEDYRSLSMATGMNNAYNSLFSLYQLRGNSDSAFYYLQLSKALSDSLNRTEKEKINEYQNLDFEEKIKAQELEKERIQKEARVRIFTLLAGIGVFVLIAFLLYRNNVQKQRANKILEKTLVDLRTTQAQLIQSEKMASLGELTAGIAHEIQNPLNFVNNFSEVNAELIGEIKQALKAGDSTEALSLTENIRQNLEKINFHGKRADGIVKSMLQHSRSSEQSGKLKKEPTDINALADEYLRLAYHGLRAKDQTFNATLKTDFEVSLSAEAAAKAGIGLIQVIPQDIARAILNLITNAFYAVHEKGKKMQLKGELFSPTVSVTTKRQGEKIEIRIKDNGPGIPQNVLDKIFQPFFTTKPTGQGTGLGLSLAYDIIKAHGGTITVNTFNDPPGGELKVYTTVDESLSTEALTKEGSEFIIQLPNS